MNTKKKKNKKKWSKEDCNEDCKEAYAFLYVIDKPPGRNATQGTYYIERERTKYTATLLNDNKLAHEGRYIIKQMLNKDSFKLQVVADIQQIESVTLEMSAVDNGINKWQ